MSLDVSTPEKEGALQVSKSRKLPILITVEEMANLFEELGSFHLFDVSRPVSLEKGEISREDFLEAYSRYVEGIKNGNLTDETPLRPFFSAAMTIDPDLLYAMELKNGDYLVKARRPVVQLQRHHFIYTDAFYSGVMGENSITWGIQFSYPQLYLDPQTNEIGKVGKSEEFPNSVLFDRLAKWVRRETRATPFLTEKGKENQPIRLGKKCFSWINRHPGLIARNLKVAHD
ncbi:MAG: hypothetical protein KR126chlam1_00910 [Chlamydiae bacterium]|nr:hypothetical protein [Chlamydiota bacterium]